MTQVTFQGSPVQLAGTFPVVGTQAPAFTLCGADLSDITLDSVKGKKVVLNIFPSIDTPVCALGVKAFNQKAANTENTVVLCISADLPFATGRFCEAEGIENVQTASLFRSPEFAEAYGVKLAEGALRDLATRAVVVLNEEGLVIHAELVAEITDEPNYDAAIAALQK
ncbi:thiol peroxidase [Photobacterium angustum]|uniref:Thiol peroxidase n=1 Tax=Photobacterium angustum (strain S14 / CCUG 15956) TaxID=314292 RepID=Q1ZN01_PHOAS|nr:MULTISPECIES: thiol peroxidase [Photobacterium]EAS63537.1 thiol peroxidase [Vibrio angustum S14] [Photobacterium angustum S14]KJG30914.1 thiol peroxidase [Photobacterium angustum]PSV57355.1 thiol peroxidase [Photobacterium sp. GB-3]PSW92078.1 thiol peroxidase [Photobacterium angustum]